MSWIFVKQRTLECEAKFTFNGYKHIDYYTVDCFSKTDGRFERDKLFFNDDSYLIILDGVILNSKELFEKYHIDNMEKAVTLMYKKNGQEFFNEFRGPFCGLLYDKEKDIFVTFCNQTGDVPLFSFENQDYIVVSSDFNCMVKFLKENNIQYFLNNQAVTYMLTFGYLIDNNTFVSEINRLRPGRYLLYRNAILEEKIYFAFKNKKFLDISEEEAIELVDEGFKKAVRRCFEKDLEYGYEHHLVDLSGGLDSRMVTWVAKRLGYNNITNINYSKADSEDEKCAKAVVDSLKNEFIHKQLDDLTFFYDIDDIVQKNYGLAYYAGSTGCNQFLSDINFNKFGLEHTGQIGDVVIGTFCTSAEHTPPNDMLYRYSDLLKCEVPIIQDFENQELFSLYVRGFQGALTSHCIRRNYTEVVSPFIDVDFLSLCLSIPLQYRVNHNLYWKWIETKYAEAGIIVSTRKKDNKDYKQKFKNIVKKIIGKNKTTVILVLKKLKMSKIIDNPNSMNPFDYWYDTNLDLRKFIDTYYYDNIRLFDEKLHIKKDIEKLFNSPKTVDKLLALTVVSMYKNYFAN